MTGDQIVLSLTLAIFNIATALLIKIVLANIDVGLILAEKRPDVVEAQTKMIATRATIQPASAAGQGTAAANPPDTQSASRVVGLIGAIVLATFMWAIANIVIYKAFTKVEDIATLLEKMSTFVWSGSALFAPYAFNQLATVFDLKPKKP